ncbi:MAG: hypothetical protein Q7K57_17735 [Burkholderiaceae bacterium]|nr:hypothetical protein [Burkholderiaceae bacterium]
MPPGAADAVFRASLATYLVAACAHSTGATRYFYHQYPPTPPVAFIRLFDAQQKNVVGPTEGEGAFRLSRRCLDIWQARSVSQVKTAEIGDVASPKAFAKLYCQSVSQQGKQCIPTRSPLVALLFKLNNMPTNLEVGVHLHQINATGRGAANAANNAAIRFATEHLD